MNEYGLINDFMAQGMSAQEAIAAASAKLRREAEEAGEVFDEDGELAAIQAEQNRAEQFHARDREW
jgi:hypothetical protein